MRSPGRAVGIALLASACVGACAVWGCAGDAAKAIDDAIDDASNIGSDAAADSFASVDGVTTDAKTPGDDGDDGDAVGADANDGGVGLDVGDGGCFVSTVGTFGECITLSACTALGDHVSTSGYCPGSASIECCTRAPNVADNPPIPTGWKSMEQSAVTSDMTTWAVSILHDPTTYPMFATTTRTFGAVDVLARVEWHPPDFLNSAIHRGVTLYSK